MWKLLLRFFAMSFTPFSFSQSAIYSPSSVAEAALSVCELCEQIKLFCFAFHIYLIIFETFVIFMNYMLISKLFYFSMYVVCDVSWASAVEKCTHKWMERSNSFNSFADALCQVFSLRFFPTFSPSPHTEKYGYNGEEGV
jgi:hypothetical protein